jgi:hypothetical protein
MTADTIAKDLGLTGVDSTQVLGYWERSVVLANSYEASTIQLSVPSSAILLRRHEPATHVQVQLTKNVARIRLRVPRVWIFQDEKDLCCIA